MPRIELIDLIEVVNSRKIISNSCAFEAACIIKLEWLSFAEWNQNEGLGLVEMNPVKYLCECYEEYNLM